MEEICIRTAKFERRIEEVLCRYPYIVAERKGKIVGYAYVHAFYARPAYDWSVETSVYALSERDLWQGASQRLRLLK